MFLPINEIAAFVMPNCISSILGMLTFRYIYKSGWSRCCGMIEWSFFLPFNFNTFNLIEKKWLFLILLVEPVLWV